MTQPVEDVEKLASKIEVATAEYNQDGFDEKRYEIIKDIVIDGFAVRDAELQRLREAATELCATVKECVLSSNHCFGSHDFNCRFEIAYWATDKDVVTAHERAKQAGCNCGLDEEHNKTEAAVAKCRAALRTNHQEPSDESSK